MTKTGGMGGPVPEAEIARWAAGADIGLIEMEDIDSGSIIPFLVRHRLALRFFYRFMQGNPGWPRDGSGAMPPWCNRRFLRRLQGLVLATWAFYYEQRRALAEVSRALGSISGSPGTRPLVSIKGGSVYALTGNIRCLHASGDVDVLWEDGRRLAEVLMARGFTGAEYHFYNPEYQNYHRGRMNFEVHQVYPGAEFPDIADGDDFAPALHPGKWLQTTQPHISKPIAYGDLVTNSARGVVSSADGLVYPGLEMCALILCNHRLRDYAATPMHDPCPVRLGELADIVDLVREPAFSHRKFAELAVEFDSRDCVRYANWLLSDALEVGSLLPMEAAAYRSLDCPPRRLSWMGGWARVNTAVDLLLPIPFETFVDRLLPSEVGEAQIGRPAPTLDPCVGSISCDRQVIHSPFGITCDLSLKASFEPDYVVLNLRLVSARMPDYFVEAISASPRIGALVLVSKGKSRVFWSHFGADLPVSVDLADALCSIHLRFSRTALASQLESGSEVSLLMSVEQWNVDMAPSLGQPDPVVFIPLKLHINSSAN